MALSSTPQFTDENATCMFVGEDIFVMLLVEKFFKTFTKKEISDTSKEVIEAEEYERPDFNDMINRVWEIKQKHKVDNNNLTIWCNAANPEIWGSLKRMFNEPYAEKYVFDKLIYYRKNNRVA